MKALTAGTLSEVRAKDARRLVHTARAMLATVGTAAERLWESWCWGDVPSDLDVWAERYLDERRRREIVEAAAARASRQFFLFG